MKKVFSIVFAMLILLSGIHLSVATHVCGGEVAAVKWSVTGEKATCGMESAQTACPVHGGIASTCCQDQVSVYQIDDNYSPSDFRIKKPITSLLQVLSAPVCLLFHTSVPSISLCTDISPRDKLQVSSVSQEKICVFLI